MKSKEQTIDDIRPIFEALAHLKDKILFKGGTSLFLTFENMKRISADIDFMYIKEDGFIDKVVDLLREQGYKVEKNTDEMGYGVAFTASKDNNTYDIDMSSYHLTRIESCASNKVMHGIGIFKPLYTFYEKILAASTAIHSWNHNDPAISQIRKLRHVEDVVNMFIHENIFVDEDEHNRNARRVARTNEQFLDKLSSIQDWSQLYIFGDITNLKRFYETKYNMSNAYVDGAEKIEFNKLCSVLKEIKSKLEGVRFE